ncbi:hypothetical protein MVEN_01598500 [Mycena venus]|uniref:Uncharacterized protein n=1 Tax=Mycena venus TaxID=2733690 RepID=A0A8H7CSF3_9AGAR|nr:hypothetical protein MVEN_01598500 [Mycena venus]
MRYDSVPRVVTYGILGLLPFDHVLPPRNRLSQHPSTLSDAEHALFTASLADLAARKERKTQNTLHRSSRPQASQSHAHAHAYPFPSHARRIWIVVVHREICYVTLHILCLFPALTLGGSALLRLVPHTEARPLSIGILNHLSVAHQTVLNTFILHLTPWIYMKSRGFWSPAFTANANTTVPEPFCKPKSTSYGAPTPRTAPLTRSAFPPAAPPPLSSSAYSQSVEFNANVLAPLPSSASSFSAFASHAQAVSVSHRPTLSHVPCIGGPEGGYVRNEDEAQGRPASTSASPCDTEQLCHCIHYTQNADVTERFRIVEDGFGTHASGGVRHLVIVRLLPAHLSSLIRNAPGRMTSNAVCHRPILLPYAQSPHPPYPGLSWTTRATLAIGGEAGEVGSRWLRRFVGV